MSNFKHIYILIIALSFSLAACHTTQPALRQQTPPPATADTTAIPLLPAEAIYLVGQEYLAIHDATTEKYHTSRAAQVRRDSITMA